MFQNHFERSRIVREEILTSSYIFEVFRNLLNTPEFPSKDPRCFGEGTMNMIYACGGTGSGLYVALRIPLQNKQSIAEQLFMNYCERAARLEIEEKVVPNFCIPVIGTQRKGLCVEDLRRGGNNIEARDGVEYATRTGDSNEYYVDLDYFPKDSRDEDAWSKFGHPEKRYMTIAIQL